METAEVEARVAESEAVTHPRPASAGPEMYAFSRWVHVGGGADQCEEVDETAGHNECNNPTHFHAWVRLPNKLQREDLENTGAAARARKLRELRNMEGDARQTLEAELYPLSIDGSIEVMADDLLREDWGRDYIQATKEVREERDEEYEFLEKDKLRYQDLYAEHGQKPTDEWPQELKELHQHIEDYLRLVQEQVKVIQAPKRQTLIEQGRESLVGLIRDKRIAELGTRAYASAYNVQEWLTCTYVSPGAAGGRTRRWSSEEQMRDESPEVIAAIERAFTELEGAFHQGVMSGNS